MLMSLFFFIKDFKHKLLNYCQMHLSERGKGNGLHFSSVGPLYPMLVTPTTLNNSNNNKQTGN